jgi:hypothetical protein
MLQETLVEATVETATTKRGRPVNTSSARQARLAARAERVAAGGSAGKGRPADPTSARQVRLAAIQARIDAGETIKRGRPSPAQISEMLADIVID